MINILKMYVKILVPSGDGPGPTNPCCLGAIDGITDVRKLQTLTKVSFQNLKTFVDLSHYKL